MSDNSLSPEMVSDISNLGSVSSNLSFRDVKDYEKYSSDPKLVLKNVTIKNNHRLVIGNLNSNPISIKFDNLKVQGKLQSKIDGLVLTETKTDLTFPSNRFLIQGYSKLYRFHRNRSGIDVFIYVREVRN